MKRVEDVETFLRFAIPFVRAGNPSCNLSKAGWSWDCSSQTDSTGRVLFTADAYSRDGRRFIILSDEKLSAFLELESAIRASGEFT